MILTNNQRDIIRKREHSQKNKSILETPNKKQNYSHAKLFTRFEMETWGNNMYERAMKELQEKIMKEIDNIFYIKGHEFPCLSVDKVLELKSSLNKLFEETRK